MQVQLDRLDRYGDPLPISEVERVHEHEQREHPRHVALRVADCLGRAHTETSNRTAGAPHATAARAPGASLGCRVPGSTLPPPTSPFEHPRRGVRRGAAIRAGRRSSRGKLARWAELAIAAAALTAGRPVRADTAADPWAWTPFEPCPHCNLYVGAGMTFNYFQWTDGVVVPVTLELDDGRWELGAFRFATS